MGTSKGYIPPAKPEWSNAKRAAKEINYQLEESGSYLRMEWVERLNLEDVFPFTLF